MLLSQFVRTAAVTGRTDYLQSWLGERQGGRWAQQAVGSIVPAARPRTEALKDLDELHARGVVTDAEYEQLRRRVS
jgi:hypothetical protein